MKKKLVIILMLTIFTSVCNISVQAKTYKNSSLKEAIYMYKSQNYTQSYEKLQDIVKSDPSNALAYYYLAMASVMVGEKDKAIDYYDNVLSLTSVGTLHDYALKGKTCIETPDRCHSILEKSGLDNFILPNNKKQFSDSVRNDYEKQQIDNIMREINKGKELNHKDFKIYKDFSSELPSSSDIQKAISVLNIANERGLLGNIEHNTLSNYSDIINENYSNLYLNSFDTTSLNEQMIKSLLTNQLTKGI